MENGKYLILPVFLLAGLVVVTPNTVFSYADSTTHPALTQETVEFFNYHYPEQAFSDRERELIMQGSIDEDHNPVHRPLRHFFDPVYERGLNLEGVQFVSSKLWSQDPVLQAQSKFNRVTGAITGLFSADADYSWERNIYEYVYGDKNRSLEGLGHVVHLIQDATVPDHTRNDPHPPTEEQKSPYEGWTAQFSPGLDTAETLIGEGERPVLYENLSTYFDMVASFSNTNFFSKDRIDVSEYKEPNPFSLNRTNLNDNIQLLYSEHFGPLTFREEIKRYGTKETEEIYYLKTDKDPDNLVLSSYWNHLSREAVLNGAGVIKLFFDEVEKERETGELLAKNTSVLKKTTAAVGNAVTNTTTAIGNAASKVGAALGKVIPSFGLAEGQGASVGTIDIDNPLDITLNTEEGNASVVEDEDPQPEVVEENEEPLNTTPPQTQQLSEEEINRIRQQLADMEEQVNQLAQKQRTEEETTDTTPPVPIAGGGGAPAEQEQNTTSGGGANNSADTTPPPALSILTPEHNAISTTTPVLVTGTSTEEDVVVIEEVTGATTTVDQNGDWVLSLGNLTQGTTTLSFVAEDQAGNKSEDTPHTLFLDTIGPTLSLSIAQCSSQSLFSDSCVLTEGEIDVVWQAPEVATTTTFTLTYGTTTTQTSATSTSLTLAEGVTDVSVSATDAFGNIETKTQQVVVDFAPIVINEVAWMGTEALSSDEWIELYNTTDKEISLDGWHIRSEDGSPEVALTGTIEARGYYLLERTDDDTISDIAADQIYTGALDNTTHSGDELYLQQVTDNGTTTIDVAPARCGISGGRWCAGDNNRHLSMERIDPNVPGTDLENWEDSLGVYHEEFPLLNGTDVDGNIIKGTPGQKNSVRALVSPAGSQIREDITLTKEHSPYVVRRHGLTVKGDATLTIEPGVVIKVVSPNEPSIWVEGTVHAQGTAEEPVVFTSFVDDEYGGDMNEDGICDPDNASSTAVCPNPGNWKRVHFKNTSTDNVLEHTLFRYGGRYFTPSHGTGRSMVAADHADITLDHVTIEHGRYHGLAWEGGNVVLTNSTIRGHGEGENSSCGADGEGGTATITGNTFVGNITGLCVSGVEGDIIDNEFIDHINPGYKTGIAMKIGGQKSGSIITGNTGEGNDNNAIGLRTGTVGFGESLTLKQNELPYLIFSQVTIGETSELIFAPGTVVKFDDRDMFVKGTLKAQGTSNQPIVFTTISDDEYGGDLQGNGPSSNIGHNDDGIRLEDNATSTFSHVIFRYFDPALSYEQDTPIDLADVLFEHNALGVEALSDTSIIRAENISFVDNEATSTVSLIQTSTSTDP